MGPPVAAGCGRNSEHPVLRFVPGDPGLRAPCAETHSLPPPERPARRPAPLGIDRSRVTVANPAQLVALPATRRPPRGLPGPAAWLRCFNEPPDALSAAHRPQHLHELKRCVVSVGGLGRSGRRRRTQRTQARGFPQQCAGDAARTWSLGQAVGAVRGFHGGVGHRDCAKPRRRCRRPRQRRPASGAPKRCPTLAERRQSHRAGARLAMVQLCY